MNEIISALARTEERAAALRKTVRAKPICSDFLDCRAVYEMACDHLRDTIYLFEHARKLRQQLEAEVKKEPRATLARDLSEYLPGEK